MNWKQVLMGFSSGLLVAAGIFSAVPQLSAFAPAAKAAGTALEQHASGMLDSCSDQVCARDQKTGRCHVCGVVGFLDGGSCECR